VLRVVSIQYIVSTVNTEHTSVITWLGDHQERPGALNLYPFLGVVTVVLNWWTVVCRSIAFIVLSVDTDVKWMKPNSAHGSMTRCYNLWWNAIEHGIALVHLVDEPEINRQRNHYWVLWATCCNQGSPNIAIIRFTNSPLANVKIVPIASSHAVRHRIKLKLILWLHVNVISLFVFHGRSYL